jgi:hypothetical protein
MVAVLLGFAHNGIRRLYARKWNMASAPHGPKTEGCLVLYCVNTVAYSSKHDRSGRGGFHTRPKPDRAGINPAPYWPLSVTRYVTVFRK